MKIQAQGTRNNIHWLGLKIEHRDKKQIYIGLGLNNEHGDKKQIFIGFVLVIRLHMGTTPRIDN
jgi:hypothetical protein